MKTIQTLLLAGVIAGLANQAQTAAAQGMPAEARKNIHLLFDQHAAVSRAVTMTKDRYTASTESADPKVAAALKEHVRQMEDRLKQGLRVRMHDPAFAEYSAHYADIAHVIEPTEKGIKVVVTGKTPAAIKVAQNHASVVTDFAANGWEGHGRSHPALAKPETKSAPNESPADPKKGASACCQEKGTGQACCNAGQSAVVSKSSPTPNHN